MSWTAQIGTTGGLHVPNYLYNSQTGTVPHPLQAGNVYGPFHFNPDYAGPGKAQIPNQTQARALAFGPINSAGYSSPL
jgi:hypothetical protein